MGSRLRTALALGGLLLLAVPGFALGLFAGVAWREPELVASHLLGGTRELSDGEPAPAAEGGAPGDVAAAPPTAGPAPAKPAPAKPAPAPTPPAAPRAAAAGPPRATAAAPAPAVPGERLAVQVGAFGDSASAEGLVARLQKKGYPAFVSPSAGDAGSRWRVRVGPMPTREAAERAAARLKADERLPTWVVDDSRS